MQLMEGVNLNVIQTTKFKNTSITVDLIEPLDHERFAAQTVVAELLETSNAVYPNQSELAKQLSRMYGASFGTDVLKYGNLHILRLMLSFPNEQYLPTKESTLTMAVQFLQAVLFQPLVKDGQFDAETFAIQRHNTVNFVESIPDDKQFYSALQLKQLYYHDDPDRSGLVFGSPAALRQLSAKEAYQDYQRTIQTAQVQISVLGNVDEQAVTKQLAPLAFTPRPAANIVPKAVRKIDETVAKRSERQKINQSKLDLAYQLPVYYDDQRLFSALIFNALFGATPQSKLFRNVREKHSLAYYADSNYSAVTGLLMVQTGINSADYQKVVSIVNDQLTAIIDGDFSAADLANIKADLINARLASQDSQRQLLNRQLVDGLLGRDLSVDQWCERIKSVSKADVVAVAKLARLQAIYFLDGRDDVE